MWSFGKMQGPISPSCVTVTLQIARSSSLVLGVSGEERRQMNSTGFLFSNGVVSQASDVPPVSLFLEAHPGMHASPAIVVSFINYLLHILPMADSLDTEPYIVLFEYLLTRV